MGDRRLCFAFHLFLVSLFFFSSSSIASRQLTSLVQDQPLVLENHHGTLLSGTISLNLIWYGGFSPAQRSIVADFLTALSHHPSSTNNQNQPSVSAWWKTTEKYYPSSRSNPPLTLVLGKQLLDEECSLGKSLEMKHIVELASRGEQKNTINIVLTAKDVVVDGFCMSKCGNHGYSRALGQKRGSKFAYIWVGNSEKQCPGQCAWPFHQPIYGPQTPPLVAPNGDVGLDGMVINIASLLAGTVTNPFGNGFYQGPATAPLEASSACPGIYGKGAFPGYPGELLIDSTTGASFNAHGTNGRKHLLPAMFDPSTSSCSTLV